MEGHLATTQFAVAELNYLVINPSPLCFGLSHNQSCQVSRLTGDVRGTHYYDYDEMKLILM